MRIRHLNPTQRTPFFLSANLRGHTAPPLPLRCHLHIPAPPPLIEAPSWLPTVPVKLKQELWLLRSRLPCRLVRVLYSKPTGNIILSSVQREELSDKPRNHFLEYQEVWVRWIVLNTRCVVLHLHPVSIYLYCSGSATPNGKSGTEGRKSQRVSGPYPQITSFIVLKL
jgi:hypothetical protein